MGKNPAISPYIQKLLQNPHLIRAELCRRSFFFFLQEMWHTIIEAEPIYNWHMKYLCDELQKVAYRVIAGLPKREDIIINIPPGTTKSTIVTQMFPAWCWIATLPQKGFTKAYREHYAKQARLPEDERCAQIRGGFLRFIAASYSSPLSLEHADYCRDIIRSNKYGNYFPEVAIRRDKGMKSNYKLNTGGTRFSTSVGGSVLGTHGHFILLDDPVDPRQTASDVERQSSNEWVDRTLSTRKVSKLVTVTIVIMQRLHEDDTTGHLLAKVGKGKRIKHICLPGALSEYVRPKCLKKRYVKGLLDPERMPPIVLDEMKVELGQYGYAGQVEQQPAPPEGGMFKAHRITPVNAPPDKIMQIVRYWDKAASDGKGAYTVGLKMALMQNKQFIVMDIVRGQWDSDVREKIIKQTAQMDGIQCRQYVEQEPGSGGKESAQSTIRNLAGYSIHGDRPTGDKVTRADTYSVQVNWGNVFMMKGEWNALYIDELRHFPFGKYKDQVDASSGAFAKLNNPKRAGVFGSRKRNRHGR